MIDVLKMANAGLDRIVDERDDAIARADAADATLASCNRARQAAEAECEWLRAEVATLEALILDANQRHEAVRQLPAMLVGQEPPMDSREALITR